MEYRAQHPQPASVPQKESSERLQPSWRPVAVPQVDGTWRLGYELTHGKVDFTELGELLKDHKAIGGNPVYRILDKKPYFSQTKIYVTVKTTKEAIENSFRLGNHFWGTEEDFYSQHPGFDAVKQSDEIEIIVPIRQGFFGDTSWQVSREEYYDWQGKPPKNHFSNTSPYDHLYYLPHDGVLPIERHDKNTTMYKIVGAGISYDQPLQFDAFYNEELSNDQTFLERIQLPGTVTNVVAVLADENLGDYGSVDAQRYIQQGAINTSLLHFDNGVTPVYIEQMMGGTYAERSPFDKNTGTDGYNVFLTEQEEWKLLHDVREARICQFGYDLLDRYFTIYDFSEKKKPSKAKKEVITATPQIPPTDFRQDAQTAKNPKEKLLQEYVSWCQGKISAGVLNETTKLYDYPPGGNRIKKVITDLSAGLGIPLTIEEVLTMVEYYLEHPELASSPPPESSRIVGNYQQTIDVNANELVIPDFLLQERNVLHIRPAKGQTYAPGSAVILPQAIGRETDTRIEVQGVATCMVRPGISIGEKSPKKSKTGETLFSRIAVDNLVTPSKGSFGSYAFIRNTTIIASNMLLNGVIFGPNVQLIGNGNHASITLNRMNMHNTPAPTEIIGFKECNFYQSKIDSDCTFETFRIYEEPGTFAFRRAGQINGKITCDLLVIDPQSPLPVMGESGSITCKTLVFSPPFSKHNRLTEDDIIRELKITREM